MKIEVLEDGDGKLKLELHTSLTFVNLLNDKIWKQKVEMSAYKMEHPYLSKPVLLVKAKNPRKAILDAAQEIIDEAKEFRKHFQNSIK